MIPANITLIGAPEVNVIRAFDEVRKRIWYRHYMWFPLDGQSRWEGSGPTLADMGSLVIEEKPGTSFTSPTGNQVAGYHSFGYIAYAKDSPLDPLTHEIAHHAGQMLAIEGWKKMGHGTVDDPYLVAVNECMRRLYYYPLMDLQHSYARAALANLSDYSAGFCEVSDAS